MQIDFSRPVPLLVGPASVLMPHSELQLLVHDAATRQITGALRATASGRAAPPLVVATATIAGQGQRRTQPRLRGTVCVGLVMERHEVGNALQRVLLHGVCRGIIRSIIEPAGGRTYRSALLEPLETVGDSKRIVRRAVDSALEILDTEPMQHMRAARGMRRAVAKVSSAWAVDVLASQFVLEPEARYRLLEEPETAVRARLMLEHVQRLGRFFSQAHVQSWSQWPKGLSWN